MDLFKDRLRIAISDCSVNAFAKKSGITEGTLRTYLSGASLPGLDKLVAISNAAQVDIEWLATGREAFKIALLTLIIEVLDDYEIELGEKLTASERANFISDVYECCSDADPDEAKTKTLILNTIKDVHKFLLSLDQMIKTEEGRTRAQKILTKKIGKILPKNDAEREVNEFIDSRILKRNEHLLKHRTKK